MSVKKVLVIGSGPIVIGQAAEFDYAGTQACRSLREEGIETVLVNSNPATIMTDEGIADVVYIEPLTVESLTRIIEQERPDGILPTLGGQTGLNMGVALYEAGVLDKYQVRLLGTSVDTIKKAEDRELFKQVLLDINEPVIESDIASDYDFAMEVGKSIGLPIIIRPAYTLGGTGGGIARTWEELDHFIKSGLSASPIHQILVEKYLGGWKEIEYEVMRDSNDTCITICNMENIDPLGVHTGDSIVVAPSQTLSDKEYQMLRSASIKIIRKLGIEGGCNVQYALDPISFQYYVIEVNPRVSRSSALASKATGYPIAQVAAKIAIGKRLDEIQNAVTRKTQAAFEPALDYCVVKIPRWPFDKFPTGDRSIGTQMKATGEVMAIDRSFEAAFQKAVRSLELGGKSLMWEEAEWSKKVEGEEASYWKYIDKANDRRMWAVFAALRRDETIEELYARSKIDYWFLRKFQLLVEMERRMLKEPMTSNLLRQAKRLGFSDDQIAALTDDLPERVREMRHRQGIVPVYKTVDTCAAEFEAVTPYFYSAYEEENEAPAITGPKAVVIGSGPIRIGQGIEFDYSSVHAAWALQEAGIQSIMVNSNPETVSTDFDTSNRLYFEALDVESVMDILENEGQDLSEAPGNTMNIPPLILQFGGQTAINLAEPLSLAGAPILGSSFDSIDIAEDRKRFENFVAGLGISQPPGATVNYYMDAFKVAETVGYPVLVRPSYVLGGRAMEICHNIEDLQRYTSTVVNISEKHPVLIDKYLEGKEVEVDAICDGQEVLIPGVMEHIERAGVHSGDSFAVYPGVNLYRHEVDTIVDYTTRIAVGLQAKGLINIQYVIWQGQVYILEVNPRASRTVPFLSKVTGVPMVKIATNIMLGKSLQEQGYAPGLWPKQPLVAVKAPVFSMAKLSGVDTALGPEMKSTGEVMGVDLTYAAAMHKALIAANMSLPKPGAAILFSIADRDKTEAIELIRDLAEIGYHIYATAGTAAMLENADLTVDVIASKLGTGHPDTVELIKGGQVKAVVNTISGRRRPLLDGFEIRRAAVENGIPCYTSLDTFRAAVAAVAAAHNEGADYNIKPLSWYRQKEH
ncbi:carbamoyl-phosphate synthase large subunit [Candidatus Chlorohelix sp.]|uniref:carbamoyl-phosphate synthase large subunit n=1 Tax=Candidatus Chlorohelix sp. TaxID=3139201 RepID=UPI00306A3250